MPNALAGALSPYLLQHADNPVDWQQWGEEAFAAARERDVPLLISVGYAACHWCHVMAHESFEDDATAAQMNEHFVCVKIDREEHPDVDAVYMEATQAMTGSGGWPMTVFATAEGKPFYCGTYFPPTPRHGIPSFPQLLTAVAQAWAERREEVLASADTITTELGQGRDFGAGGPVTSADLETAVGLIERDFDAELGGFGRAPKFPPSTVLHFLNRHYVRTGDERSRRMVDTTCEAMWRGGMYDHLAGGFARYSVDATWTVPHFEKMLYDNALLARVYLGWTSANTQSDLVRSEGFLVARDTVDFMLRDLRTPEGGLASALDADAAGEEGTTYVWTPQQLREVLGEEDGVWAAEHYGVTVAGTFERGTSVLQLPVSDADDRQRAESVRTRLLAARAERPQPMRDDKVVAAWNGMAITAICQVSSWLGDRDLVPDAVRIGELLRDVHVVDGRLRRVSRNGVAGPAPGVLEDYAHVASGFLTLHEYTADRSWLDRATGLLDAAIAHFAADEGQYYDAADDASGLVVRPTDPTDGPTPAGVAALADALVTATALTADPTYRDEADRIIARLAPIVARAPRAAGWAASVAEAMLAGPLEVAVVGGDEWGRGRFAQIARRVQRLGGVVVAGAQGGDAPLLRDRPGGERPVAYVCRGFVCEAPITETAALEAATG